MTTRVLYIVRANWTLCGRSTFFTASEQIISERDDARTEKFHFLPTRIDELISSTKRLLHTIQGNVT